MRETSLLYSIFKLIDNFYSLDSSLSNNCSLDKESQSRIGKAASTFSRLSSKTWFNVHLTLRTTGNIYKAS